MKMAEPIGHPLNPIAISPHMFEAGGVHDGEAALADHPGAGPIHVAAIVVAAEVVVVGRHLGGRRVRHKVRDWFLYLNEFECCTMESQVCKSKTTKNVFTVL